MAYSKICVYCHVVTLEGYNAEQRKYYEQGTTQLHTRERCAEARSKAGLPAHSLSATPPPTKPQSQPPIINQDQKSADIKAAQEERRQQHRELISTMQNLTKAIIADIASRRGNEANDIIDTMNYDQYREDKRDFQDEVV